MGYINMKDFFSKIKDKKIILLIFSIVIVVAILINSTYSLLSKEDVTDDQSYTTGILEITSTAVNDSVTLTSSLPMEDSDGLTSTPYTFKIENTGNLNYTFDVKLLSTTEENLINSSYINLSVDGVNVLNLSELTDGVIKEDVTLAPGKSITIDLRVWLASNTPNSEIGKSFNAKITTEGYAGYTEEKITYPSIDESGANAPSYIDGMIPVMYDESTNNWVTADTTSSTSQYGGYAYNAKKWANGVSV